MDKLDSFNVLLEEEYEIAKTLHQTGESLGCKIVFKTRPNGYRVIFNKQSNRKVLFWMEVSDNSLLVKANLLYIDNYIEKMSSCSDTIKKSIAAPCEYLSTFGMRIAEPRNITTAVPPKKVHAAVIIFLFRNLLNPEITVRNNKAPIRLSKPDQWTSASMADLANSSLT